MSLPFRRLIATGAAAVATLLLTAPPAPARTYGDPAAGRQWALAKIGAPAAWDRATGAGITIAVLDSGIDLGHEDFAGKLLPGRDFTDSGSVQDDCGHGTHVSGVAAAASGNGKGIVGIAPDAKILPVKVLVQDGQDCVGSLDTVADAIEWAADQGAHVINLSLGSDVQFLFGSGLGDSLSYAWQKGSIPIVAAGNQFLLGSGYSDEPAIIVTASGTQDQKPSYSSTSGGARWSMAAPGGDGSGDEDDILSTYYERGRTNSYATLAGTSMATPHVSGAAAILRSMGLTPQQVVDRLLATAADLGPRGKDNTFGSGRLDLAKAVGTAAAGTPVTGAPPGTTATTRAASGPRATTAPSRPTPGRGPGTTVVRTGPGTAPDAAPDTSATTPAPGPTITAAPEDLASPPGEITLVDEAADGGDRDDEGVPTGLVVGAAVALLAAGASAIVFRARARG